MLDFNFDGMSGAQLRLELAEAEYEKPKSWRASEIKKMRIAAITHELVQRGSF